MVATTDADNDLQLTDSNGMLFPQYTSFAAIFNQFSRAYSHRWDEAIRHSASNALAMRRDTFILSLLQERQLPVTAMNWSIIPEDENDANQVHICGTLTKIVERTPRWQSMLLNLQQALWYGRYGVQIVPKVCEVMGQRRWVVGEHSPVNGDKIQYQWDGTPLVFLNASELGSRFQSEDIVYTDRVPALRLHRDEWRSRFIIHKHLSDDADFFEGEMAGGVHGVGLRSQVYWTWWLRDEFLAWATDFMQKVGTLGLMVFYYEMGNPKSQEAAERAARDCSRRNAITMPRPSGSSKETASAELLQPTNTGIETLKGMIADYFESHIQRLIVGQSLSGNAGSTGLGSGVSDLHADTKYQLLKFDAGNLSGTLTTDLVGPLMRWNFPWAKFAARFQINVPDPNNKEQMEAVSKASSLGVTFRADDVRKLTGMAKPGPDDEVIGQQQQQSPGLGMADADPLAQLQRSVSMLYQLVAERIPWHYAEPPEDPEFERKHPRRSDGKFGKKGAPGDAGGSDPRPTETPAQRKRRLTRDSMEQRERRELRDHWNRIRAEGLGNVDDVPWALAYLGSRSVKTLEKLAKETMPEEVKSYVRQILDDKTKVVILDHAAAEKAFQDFFGHPVESSTIKALAWGRDGCDAELEVVSSGDTIKLALSSAVYRGKSAFGTSRTIRRDKDGKIVLENDYAKIGKKSRLRGLSAECLLAQAQAAEKLGISRIETYAAGLFSEISDYNGYYTWARCGYLGLMDASQFLSLPPEYQRLMGRSRSIQTLMALPGGRDVWKRHGSGWVGVFNPKTGSRSRQILEAYVEERRLERASGKPRKRKKPRSSRSAISRPDGANPPPIRPETPSS
ncbi:phage portal protein family protein [Tuwongella immobilis]|uniref:Uncharacterized protein n=1 Tax=Tuwongella immobilis TaxID=692036 RepID=A0A6C2YLA5_9BACT|nr:DUF935 family protein [Tuwongella immobilis]VIP02157.1 Phage head morphogenesis protein, SPP1 gp7 OS=Methylomicrobium album BG8 GN=Metal_0149 PE=4 SV=1: DUF935 [Tuwongella immobilis]VTS00558.1 Phage head morphogenesis protein, SPP1 gp7 OS=Methylomicrobium album BG8 GN=Metal_0149 PE=4 SV=1: DUF935 [Tuwongella immobilis]